MAAPTGVRAFADASFFSEALDSPKTLEKQLVELFLEDAALTPGVLPKRFMYGTDWKMLVTQAEVEQYLRRFAEVIANVTAELAAKGLPIPMLGQQFFGANAVDYLGLRRGEHSRNRLERFYACAGLEVTPTWMTKVDRLPS